MLDIAATREADHEGLISDMGSVCSHLNLADGLAKLISLAAIQQAIISGQLDLDLPR